MICVAVQMGSVALHIFYVIALDRSVLDYIPACPEKVWTIYENWGKGVKLIVKQMIYLCASNTRNTDAELYLSKFLENCCLHKLNTFIFTLNHFCF